MPAGRPHKKTPEEIQELLEMLTKYVDETPIPIIAEFAYKNDILRTELYNYEELSTQLKKCVAKKEAQLEKLALAGKVKNAMAIFSLKQLGWTDKQDINQNISGNMNNTIKVEFVKNSPA